MATNGHFIKKIILMLIANLFCLAATLGLAHWLVLCTLFRGFCDYRSCPYHRKAGNAFFFISRGVGYAFEPRNNHYIDRISLISFVIFFLLEVLPHSSCLPVYVRWFVH